jgi:hypothetical protein
MGQVYHYCAMRSICLLNRAISPTFLPLYPGHSRFHQMYFPPSSPPDLVDSTRCTVFSSWGSRVIFKRLAALNSDHCPVLGLLVRCLGFLVLYILWSKGRMQYRLTGIGEVGGWGEGGGWVPKLPARETMPVWPQVKHT